LFPENYKLGKVEPLSWNMVKSVDAADMADVVYLVDVVVVDAVDMGRLRCV